MVQTYFQTSAGMRRDKMLQIGKITSLSTCITGKYLIQK